MPANIRLVSPIFALALFAADANAAPCSSYPNILANGSLADATQVMANFESIRSCANSSLAPLDSPVFTGNVGIGTVPATLGDGGSPVILQVHGGSGYGLLQLSSNQTANGGNTGVITFGSTGPSGQKRTGEIISFIDNTATTNAAGRLQFYTTDGAGNIPERMRIDSAGRIGIGTATPGQTLTINGYNYGAQPGYTLQVVGNGNNQVNITPTMNAWGLLLGSDPSGQSVSLYHGPNYDYLINVNNAPLVLGANNTPAVAILGSGNVGIGTMAPGAALDVVGTIRQGGCTTAGTLAVDGSGDIICASDARLKNVLGDYAGGLAIVAHLSPKLFTYKSTHGDPNETFVHAGFLAQNVMSVIPQASALQRDGTYSLDTTAILAATVNSVKELKVIVDRQDKEIVRLKAELAAESGQQASAMEQMRAQIAELRRSRRIDAALR